MSRLAAKGEIDLSDWEKITGTRVDVEGKSGYIVTVQGVKFVGHDDKFIEGWPLRDREAMRDQNEASVLTFPCAPKELLDFVDADPAGLGGLSVPDDFRNAVMMSEMKAALKAKKEEKAHTEEMATTKAPEKVPVQKQQELAILNWLTKNKYDPKKLPVFPKGKPGVRKACRDGLEGPMFGSKSVFNKAWERLQSQKLISSA